MITMDNDLSAMHRQALQRQARARVDLLDELRAVQNASRRGLTQRETADILATSQAKVNRMLKAIERRNADLAPDPEEMILRAFAYNTPRQKLIAELKAFPYTFGQDAPYPHEGRLPGTWDRVVTALAQGLIDESEFNEVRSAIGR
ncbi:hypothetical protein [Paenarthrobacter sp. PH39-S1]|uniref:hypothetical protein n=1 Tax=Paenarthrobacter sp. PH39-S1 TaxID=3046204 RepID=UPI0024B9BAB6|nr:hypothetical protein [Paenarthrobacter sp. PH39-S1]MDJ0358580.1 hypothetical protein [Paenarthrobacter sp. PH39-S1]